MERRWNFKASFDSSSTTLEWLEEGAEDCTEGGVGGGGGNGIQVSICGRAAKKCDQHPMVGCH